MKKIAGILLVFFCIIIVVYVVQFAGREPVLNVMVSNDSKTEAGVGYTIYSNGKTREISAFDKDPNATFYKVASGGFQSSIVDGHIVNTLQETMLKDEAGNVFPPDEEEKALMQEAANMISHDIWDFTLIRIGNKLFAFVKLNVNWFTPCELYLFDSETQQLTLLHQWDDVDLIAVSEP